MYVEVAQLHKMVIPVQIQTVKDGLQIVEEIILDLVQTEKGGHVTNDNMKKEGLSLEETIHS